MTLIDPYGNARLVVLLDVLAANSYSEVEVGVKGVAVNVRIVAHVSVAGNPPKICLRIGANNDLTVFYPPRRGFIEPIH